jgi:hypothetical protein
MNNEQTQSEFKFIKPDLGKQVDSISSDFSTRIIFKSTFNRLWPIWEIYTSQEELLSLIAVALNYFESVDDVILHLENIAGSLNDEANLRRLKDLKLIGIANYDKLNEEQYTQVLDIFANDKEAIKFLIALSKDQLLPEKDSLFCQTLNIVAAVPV